VNPAEKSADNTDTLILLVGRMDGKLDMLLTRDKEQDAKIAAHDERIAALENDRAKVLGIWAVVSLGLGWVGDHLFTTFWTK